MSTATAVRAAPTSRDKRVQPGMHAESFNIEQDGQAATTPLMAGAGGASTQGNSSSRTIASLLDSYCSPLVVPNDMAFKALLIAPLLVWWVAIGAGMWVYEGLPKGQRVYHVMLWFDKGLLRPAGPLVPFAVVLLRALVHAADHFWRQQQRRQQGNNSSIVTAKQRCSLGLRLGTLVLNCLTIYAAMAVARLAIYLTHFFLLTQRYLEFHLVSDHIFLGATMLICLHTEVVCLMSDMLHLQAAMQSSSGQPDCQDPVSLTEVFLTLLFVLALFLYLFTAADMYFTARYYHFPLESFSTTVLVFFLFQLPMLFWLWRRRQRLHLSHTV